ncbi:hypothetical protein HYPSUDRAFT_149621 [Hypholoma sublateritium FD-334 SS-4]|uniref:Uncharacterized protein n=1 Tax=Hypholoma sublateritium (strain FD-334 SS-4) TaxID=945553 RepID=A0A0D2LW20_HYPSF|nr:hypothetical protein HYPSUDRAFT_149621 [Hypholoma sublateritium FD-334 SS-4]
MEDLPKVTYRMLLAQEGTMNPGAIVMKGPYEQYLEGLEPGETPKTLLVAGESQFLKTVYLLINAKAKSETLTNHVDFARHGGETQFTAIFIKVGTQLPTYMKTAVSWDPEVIIHMQSANKQVEKTCGLARNIPFQYMSWINQPIMCF